MKVRIILLMLILVGVVVSSAFAQVPQLINYQGVLTDPTTGSPVPDDTYSITFSIYSVPSGGTPEWTETQSVTTTSGRFNVLLGSVSPIAYTVFSGGDRYLGVKVGMDAEMTPRKRIVSVGYAFMARDADKVDGQDAAAFAPTVHNHDDRYYAESELNTNDGTVNQGEDPVSWYKIKDMPSGFEDGIDDVGAAGGVSQINAGTGITVTNPTGPTATVAANIGTGADQVAAGNHNHDAAYVNEGQGNSISTGMIQNNAVTAAKISPDIVSSVDGVTNDGGNIDLVAGSNITITPDDANNRITISATGGAITSVDSLNGGTIHSTLIVEGDIRTGHPSGSSSGPDDIESTDDVYADDIVYAGNDLIAVDDIYTTGGLIRAGTPSSAYGDGDIAATDDVVADDAVRAGSSVVAGSDVVAARSIWTGSPTSPFGSGDIVATGDLIADDRVIGNGGVYGYGGNYGVYGSKGSNFGYLASSTYGVYGKHGSSGNYGWLGHSNEGVRGYSTSGYGVYGSSPSGYAGYFSGNVHVTGTLSKGAGSFMIDHPLDPANKYLYHSFVESPDMMNIYNGNATLDPNGEAWVELPKWFDALNRDFRYQLTAIGAPGPNLYIAEEISRNRFRIAGGTPGMKVSWQVTGIRQDAFANAHRIPVEVEKLGKERGKYLYPKEHGVPETMGIDYEKAEMVEGEK